MNEIVRESVQRLGGTYVDIWPGFVDDENRYTATGPDVDGQTSRLRANDGVLFTRAGARKVAHFADTEIKRILEAKRTGTGSCRGPADRAPARAPESRPRSTSRSMRPCRRCPNSPERRRCSRSRSSDRSCR